MVDGVDGVDELLSSADSQARGQCRAGGGATSAPRAEPQGIDRCSPPASAVTHRLASATSAARACVGALAYRTPRGDERKLARSSLGLHARAAHTPQGTTMRLSGSLPTPAEVFYVVQSTGAPGRREHHVASVLYETRAQAHTELARLSAAHPGDYSVWKSTTYVEPPQWGYVVMRADGTVVPAE
jgi:hypothetical protein